VSCQLELKVVGSEGEENEAEQVQNLKYVDGIEFRK
jgi:hypothetical protein